MNKPTLSVITLNWNRSEDLNQLLTSSLHQLDKYDELIVVDNGSTDNSLDMVRSQFPQVKIVALNANIGVGGFDRGVQAAKGTHAVLLDNDTLLPDGAIKLIRDKIEQYPDYSILALNIVTSDGDRQQDYLPQNAKTEISWHNFIGGGVVFERAVYKRHGGYEPTYFIYINETEFAARLLLSGEKILFCPSIKVIHKTSPAARISEQSYYYFIRNSVLFIKTYFSFAKQIDLLSGFLLVALRGALTSGLGKAYLRGLFSGIVTHPHYRPTRKLAGDLATQFAYSWQENPSMSHILKRKLCRK